MPSGDRVFPLCIKYKYASRTLRPEALKVGISFMSAVEWPGKLKCVGTAAPEWSVFAAAMLEE